MRTGTHYEHPTVEIAGQPLGEALEVQSFRVEVLDGEEAGQRIEVDKPVFLIGTDPLCDLVLPDRTASRRHCELRVEGEVLRLVDRGSTNGTWLDGRRVMEVTLEQSTTLRAGSTHLRVSLERELQALPRDRTRYGNIVGTSPALRDVFAILDKVAPTDLALVIEGETGTGKELIVRAIHEASRRARRPLEVFDCSAFPGTLLESELFGHEKGSFSGASYTHKGVFERADGGTVFLDELGEMDIEFQAKFLRALELGEIRRVGGERTQRVDVRVVAATHRNLEELIQQGRFRQDLFYRLAKVRFRLPPLRERLEDIPLLCDFFLDQLAPALGSRPTITPGALAVMQSYAWPGNIRELRNIVERAATLCEGVIHTEYIAAELGVEPPHPSRGVAAEPAEPPPTFRHTLESPEGDLLPLREAKDQLVSEFERHYLERLLEKHQQNISAAAREADVDRRHFYRLLKKYGLMK